VLLYVDRINRQKYSALSLPAKIVDGPLKNGHYRLMTIHGVISSTAAPSELKQVASSSYPALQRLLVKNWSTMPQLSIKAAYNAAYNTQEPSNTSLDIDRTTSFLTGAITETISIPAPIIPNAEMQSEIKETLQDDNNDICMSAEPSTTSDPMMIDNDNVSAIEVAVNHPTSTNTVIIKPAHSQSQKRKRKRTLSISQHNQCFRKPDSREPEIPLYIIKRNRETCKVAKYVVAFGNRISNEDVMFSSQTVTSKWFDMNEERQKMLADFLAKTGQTTPRTQVASSRKPTPKKKRGKAQ
jgi:hypothetical protein